MIRNFRSPLSEEQLRPLDPECRLMQIGESMTGAEIQEIAALAAEHPDVELRVYGQRTVPDLEFLELFPSLLRFTVEVFELESIEGLRHLRSDLEHLGLGRTRSTAHSLGVLDRFDALRSLWLEGHHKDFDTVGRLKSLERLSLRSMTLPGLSMLTDLDRLRSFELEDLTPIADAPNLEQLLLVDMKHLSPDSVHPFVGHAVLRAASVGLGSTRKKAARDLLDLPDVDTPEEQFG